MSFVCVKCLQNRNASERHTLKILMVKGFCKTCVIQYVDIKDRKRFKNQANWNKKIWLDCESVEEYIQYNNDKNVKVQIKNKISQQSPKYRAYQRKRYEYINVDKEKCRSKGEKIISEFLKNNNMKFKEQFTFDDCKHIQKLKVDFVIFIKDKILAIEFNGKQHYEKIGNDIWNLAEIQLRDAVKEQYLNFNNIPLLILKYDEKNILERIQNFLEMI